MEVFLRAVENTIGKVGEDDSSRNGMPARSVQADFFEEARAATKVAEGMLRLQIQQSALRFDKLAVIGGVFENVVAEMILLSAHHVILPLATHIGDLFPLDARPFLPHFFQQGSGEGRGSDDFTAVYEVENLVGDDLE